MSLNEGLTVAMLVVTTGAMIATGMYVYLTRELLRSQCDPKVIVFVRHDSDRRTILQIVVQNIGRDIAYDVAFHPSRPIPARAFGVEEAKSATVDMTSGPLVTGIPALGPGDKREMTWGQYGGLTAALADQPITLDYTYRTRGGRKLIGQAVLEVESYSYTDAHQTPAVSAAQSLGEIAKSVERIARSLSNREDANEKTR